MRELQLNLWDFESSDLFLRCVTTNGIVKANGELVMGAGLAKQAALKYPDVPYRLGQIVKKYGNRPVVFWEHNLVSFPTKNNWKEDSCLELILRSATAIADIQKQYDCIIAATRVGCGLGNLSWNEVKPLLAKIWVSDNFIICGGA